MIKEYIESNTKIDGIPITQVEKYNICVKLSGGADSSIIYYALCYDYKDDPNVQIIPVTIGTDEKWWYPEGAKNVIKVVGELTGKYPPEHIVIENIKHTEPNYIEAQCTAEEQAIKKYNIHEDLLFSGLTNNPNIKNMRSYFKSNSGKLGLDKIKALEGIDRRDPTRDPNGTWSLIGGKKYQISRPTALKRNTQFTDKLGTASWYKHYNVMDTLYPHTFSCEAPGDVFEDKDFLPGDPHVHCNYCFFCLERYFAFGRII